MKNLLMIAVALVTISATAQERKKEAHKGEMKDRMEMREDMTPEELAKLQTKKMTLHLDLSEKQQTEVEKLLLEEAKTRKAKMESLKAKKEAGAEKPSKEERLKMANDRLDHQIEMKKKMKAILTPEQYDKFDKIQSKRGAMRGKKDEMKKHRD
ncbi:MAG: hypothetical protein R2783_06530 [Gelidibacter sp.]